MSLERSCIDLEPRSSGAVIAWAAPGHCKSNTNNIAVADSKKRRMNPRRLGAQAR